MKKASRNSGRGHRSCAEPAGSAPFLLDCKGREILVGDVIRVKHFTTRHGRGHKQHWMYKLVIDRLVLGSVKPMPALKILSLQDPAKKPHHYYEKLDGSLNDGIEIVNGLNADARGRMVNFDQRPRRLPNAGAVGPGKERQPTANPPDHTHR